MGRRSHLVPRLEERLNELRRMAEREGVADEVGEILDVETTIRAYADVLNLDIALVTSTELTLSDIKSLS